MHSNLTYDLQSFAHLKAFATLWPLNLTHLLIMAVDVGSAGLRFLLFHNVSLKFVT